MNIRKNKSKKDEIEILDFDDDKKISKVDNIKKFLSDKRNKAIVKLSIYGVFILIVCIYVRIIGSQPRKVIKNNETNSTVVNIPNTITNKTSILKSDNDYTFKINYNISSDNDYEYIIEGKRENNIISINVNDIIYYYDINGFYELIDNEKSYIDDPLLNDLHLYFPNIVYQYLLNSNYQYKKEDIDKNITINSLLKVSDFAYINNNIINNDSNIIVETTENSNNNNLNIFMDMTNYYIMFDNSIRKYYIEVEIIY